MPLCGEKINKTIEKERIPWISKGFSLWCSVVYYTMGWKKCNYFLIENVEKAKSFENESAKGIDKNGGLCYNNGTIFKLVQRCRQD